MQRKGEYVLQKEVKKLYKCSIQLLPNSIEKIDVYKMLLYLLHNKLLHNLRKSGKHLF